MNDIDLNLIKKVWNEILHCPCIIKENDDKVGGFLVLRGENRNELKDFLIEKGI